MKNTKISVFDRFNLLLSELGMNPNEFGRALGYERTDKIYNIVKGRFNPSFDILADISRRFPGVNLDWLIGGDGDIFKIGNHFAKPDEGSEYAVGGSPDIAADSGGAAGYALEVVSANLLEDAQAQKIPVNELESVNGLVGLFADPYKQTPVNYISIPGLPPCDGGLYVKGDSMYPLLKNSDIVLYKKVGDVSRIIWGEMYLVSFSMDGDEYFTVKYIYEANSGSDKILLRSYNPQHADLEVPVDSIRALGMVKASVRFNSIG